MDKQSLVMERDKNVRKTWVLMAGFFVAVVVIGFSLSAFFKNPTFLYGAVFLSLLMNIGSFWFADKLVVVLTGAKPASRNDYPDLYVTLENLSAGAGIKPPSLYVIDDPAPNAFATGRSPEHALVAVTTGLLPLLEKNELEGVLAHEISHITNRDMLVSTMAVVLVGLVSILADLFLRFSWINDGDRDTRAGALLFIMGIVASILAPIAGMLIQLAISRKREFLADASGALLTKYPEGLARALEKISKFPQAMKQVSHATAHLFISSPMGHEIGGSDKEISPLTKLFMTHPPVEERVKALLGR